MRIEFTKGGGFAAPALRQSYEVDSDELSQSEADELHSMVGALDMESLANQRSAAQPRPDAFHYRVKIDDSGSSHTIRTSDADMPESVRPLIEWLMQRASQDKA